MSGFKMYEIVEIQNPSHPRHATRGVIAGVLAADGEMMACSVRFADDTEMVDPEDLLPLNESITEHDFERGTWPPPALRRDEAGE